MCREVRVCGGREECAEWSVCVCMYVCVYHCMYVCVCVGGCYVERERECVCECVSIDLVDRVETSEALHKRMGE